MMRKIKGSERDGRTFDERETCFPSIAEPYKNVRRKDG